MRKIKRKMTEGEDELEAVEVDQKLSESQNLPYTKTYRSLWDTSYVPSKNKQKEKDLEELSQNFNLSLGCQSVWDTSYGNPLSHVNFSISLSRPFLVFTEQKAQRDTGKRSLSTKKELRSRHLCLHLTDQSCTQDSGFNLQCNNVARQVEGKCCPYYWTLT